MTFEICTNKMPELLENYQVKYKIKGIHWIKIFKVYKCCAEKYDAPHGNISFKQKLKGYWNEITG